MDGIIWNIALIIVLVLFNAAFAGSELAVVSLRASQLRRITAEHGAAGERVARLAEDPSRFLSTVQVGITLGGFLASAAAAVSLAEPLEARLDFLGGAAGLVSVIVVTLVLTFVTLVFGELVPKRIAMQRAVGWSLRAAGPLGVLARIASPVITVLSATTELVVRLLGARGGASDVENAEEEIRDLIAHQPGVSAARRSLLTGAFEVSERTAREILVPRRDIDCIAETSTIADAVAVLVESGHSRAPVMTGDTFETIVHLRDLVAAADPTRPVTDVARDALVVPESLGVLQILTNLRTAHQQMALIANEYGTIQGIITVEDVLEEIVGEIYDEFDRDTNESDVRSVVHEEDGSLRLPGAFPVHDLSDIEVDLPETTQATVAGLVIGELERIPEVGEVFTVGRWRVTVLAKENNALTELRLTPNA